MYKDNGTWMLRFQERMEQAKRYVKFCTDIYNFQRKKAGISSKNTPGW